MPGHYFHMAAADRIAARLRGLKAWPAYTQGALPGRDPQELAALAESHPNYYALGAIGPDLFFFLVDFRGNGLASAGLANSLIGVLGFLDRLYATLDDWILRRWETNFGPISENADEALSRLTGDLTTVVGDITGSLSSLLVSALLDMATQCKDWFGLFSLGLNRGYDNQDFLWSDMLHYRKTGQFGLALWRLAEEREKNPADGEDTDAAVEAANKLRAYALGYITHIGTDVTGHPFVNEKSGGPFRTHWQRHHLVENHMDARQYHVDHGGDASYSMLTEGALHFRLLFGDEEMRTLPPVLPSGGTLRGRYTRSGLLDADSEMPDDLAQLIFAAMGTAYQPVPGNDPTALTDPSRTTPKIIRPPFSDDGRPAPRLIQETFGLLFRYLRYVTVDGLGHDKPAPPEVFPNLDPPILTDPHDTAPGASDPPMDFWDLVLAILKLLLFLPELALWLATVIPAAILDLGTYGPRVAAYYTIELPLFYLVKAARQILVMTGFTLPMKDEIDTGLITLGIGSNDVFLINLGTMDDVFGGIDVTAIAPLLARVDALMEAESLTREQALSRALMERGINETPPGEPVRPSDYPHSIPIDPNLQPVEYHAPWAYPMTPVETSSTFSSPHRAGEEAPVLLTGATPGDQPLRASFERAPDPGTTDRLARQRVNRGQNLGDPIHFGTYLIWQTTRNEPPNSDASKLTDWNLDADRGYAWKCWDWDRCADRPHQHDQDNHEYLAPASQTPQQTPTTGLFDPKTDIINPTYRTTEPLRVHYLDQPDQAPLKCDGGEGDPK